MVSLQKAQPSLLQRLGKDSSSCIPSACLSPPTGRDGARHRRHMAHGRDSAQHPVGTNINTLLRFAIVHMRFSEHSASPTRSCACVYNFRFIRCTTLLKRCLKVITGRPPRLVRVLPKLGLNWPSLASNRSKSAQAWSSQGQILVELRRTQPKFCRLHGKLDQH